MQRVKILQIEKGFFKNKVLIQALDDCEIVVDSFLGEKVFYLKKDYRIFIKVSKDFLLQENDIIDFKRLFWKNPRAFDWDWFSY